eukprot:g12416.t1
MSKKSFRGAAFVGGFSYADTLDSAKGWAGSVLFSPKLEAQFRAFRDRPDSFALGICNGCQLLALLGWAPGAPGGGVLPIEKQPRFVHNRRVEGLASSHRFESRFATVRIDACAASKVWLKGMEGSQMGVWVNHGEGRCHFPDVSVMDRVKKEQLIPMRYVDDDGQATETYPFNPNGSPEGIVGLCSADGRILSIMPHPERLASWPWQWGEMTRRKLRSLTPGVDGGPQEVEGVSMAEDVPERPRLVRRQVMRLIGSAASFGA